MKVRGADGNENVLTRAQEGRVADKDVARGASSQSAIAGAVDGLAGQSRKELVDTVKFSSLGAMLRQELDPAKMMEERRAKIEALKEQIRNGSYAPSSEAVAQSVSEEVSLEVLLSGSASNAPEL